MSVSTQEVVKNWIKESQEKKLRESQTVVSGKDVVIVKAPESDWIVVGSKGKGKEKVSLGREVKEEKVYTKNFNGELNKGIPGMKSSKKLAKLEAKMLFVKKSMKESYRPKEVRVSKGVISVDTSSVQPNRGSSAVRTASL